jgi:hypothetical protein
MAMAPIPGHVITITIVPERIVLNVILEVFIIVLAYRIHLSGLVSYI